jgi:hypothetical protein
MKKKIKPKILGETKKLLDTAKGRWPAICRETGLDYNWLKRVINGKIKDPGVNKIEVLYRYLKRRS